jgi:hypothetical protein
MPFNCFFLLFLFFTKWNPHEVIKQTALEKVGLHLNHSLSKIGWKERPQWLMVGEVDVRQVPVPRLNSAIS